MSEIIDKIYTILNEKWDINYKTPDSKKDMWDGWSINDLKKERKRLLSKENRSNSESTRLKQVNFALRAKNNWSKVPE